MGPGSPGTVPYRTIKPLWRIAYHARYGSRLPICRNCTLRKSDGTNHALYGGDFEGYLSCWYVFTGRYAAEPARVIESRVDQCSNGGKAAAAASESATISSAIEVGMVSYSPGSIDSCNRISGPELVHIPPDLGT
jgi:hypothetical protein